MTKIEIENEVIKEALIRKDKMSEDMKALALEEEEFINNANEELEKMKQKANKLMAKLAKENEKVLPMLKELTEGYELAEYEEVSRTYLGKGEEEGKVFIEIADRLEEFKTNFKNGQDNSSDTTEGDGQGDTNAEESTEGDQDNSSQG